MVPEWPENGRALNPASEVGSDNGVFNLATSIALADVS
jgi:hypothetical protein